MSKNNNTIWIVAAVVIVLAIFILGTPFNTGWNGLCGMMGVYGNYGWGMMGGFGGIFMPILLIALILLIVWLIKQLQTPRRK